MKLASFRFEGASAYGIADDDRLFPASRAFRQRFPDLRAVIAAGAYGELERDAGGSEIGAADASFLPVITNPDKILCVGVNYRPHIEEMGRDVPEYPVVFVRFPGSLVGHGQPLRRPRVSAQFDFEGELAVVIGKRARHVRKEHALECVAGYCCFMDGSVRDWQRHTPQFTAGKNFQDSGAMGPCLATADDIPDPSRLTLTTSVNSEVMQRASVSDLVFDVPTLIEYCSTFTELLPGDIVATGTPGGVGAARVPPVWLKPGDTVEVAVSGIGRLQNPVLDESSQTAA